jgi:hypothetical protein
MPELSRFLGIVIAMYHRDHAPPHIHARYGDAESAIRIDPPTVLDGRLPPRVVALVIEWITLNREALLANWSRARRRELLLPIPPLV